MLSKSHIYLGINITPLLEGKDRPSTSSNSVSEYRAELGVSIFSSCDKDNETNLGYLAGCLIGFLFWLFALFESIER